MTSDDHDAVQLSRRQTLKRAAGIGAVLWTVPTMQIVTMTAANADSPSLPGVPSQPGGPPLSNEVPPPAQQPPPQQQAAGQSPPQVQAADQPAPLVQVQGTKSHRTPPGTPDAAVAPTRTQAAALPHTGLGESTISAGVVGVAAVGLGAAVLRAARHRDEQES